jgi:hypothetical protein
VRAPRLRLSDLPREQRERIRAAKRDAAAQEQGQFIRYALAAGLPAPTPEHRFHPEREWRFDWAWPEQRVALEVEGGAFAGGRHTRGAGFREDIEKYNSAAAMGWRLLRVLPEQLYDPRTIKLIHETLEAARGMGS